MVAILSTLGNLNNLDPGRGTAHRTPRTNPGLCLTDWHLHTAVEGIALYQAFPCYPGLHPLQKEIRIEIRNRAFENCFNRFL